MRLFIALAVAMFSVVAVAQPAPDVLDPSPAPERATAAPLVCPKGTVLEVGDPPAGLIELCRRADGKKEGAFRQWSPDGKLKLEGLNRNNVAEGRWHGWHPNGAPSFIGVFAGGSWSGTWRYWRPDGTRMPDVVYRDGKDVTVEESAKAQEALAKERERHAATAPAPARRGLKTEAEERAEAEADAAAWARYEQAEAEREAEREARRLAAEDARRRLSPAQEAAKAKCMAARLPPLTSDEPWVELRRPQRMPSMDRRTGRQTLPARILAKAMMATKDGQGLPMFNIGTIEVIASDGEATVLDFEGARPGYPDIAYPECRSTACDDVELVARGKSVGHMTRKLEYVREWAIEGVTVVLSEPVCSQVADIDGVRVVPLTTLSMLLIAWERHTNR